MAVERTMNSLLVTGFNAFGQFSIQQDSNEFEKVDIFSEFTDIDLVKCLSYDTFSDNDEEDKEYYQATDKDLVSTSNEDSLENKRNLPVKRKSSTTGIQSKTNRKSTQQGVRPALKEPIDYDNLIISCSWSYSVFALARSVTIRGNLLGRICSQRTVALDELLEPTDAVKAISTCDNQCLILTNSGRVIKFLPQKSLRPEKMNFSLNTGELAVINFIACGNSILAAISDKNIVFNSEDGELCSLPENFMPKQLECGFEHAVLLGLNGDIYTWGKGLRGQLGSGTLDDYTEPHLLEALAGIKVIEIGAGGWHTAAVSIYGDLYIWGYNSHGQLGIRMYQPHNPKIREQSLYALPELVDICVECSANCCSDEESSSCVPVRLALGDRHTAVLAKCGAICMAGCNKYGQLGISEQKFVDKFTISMKLGNNANLEENQIELKACSWNTLLRLPKSMIESKK